VSTETRTQKSKFTSFQVSDATFFSPGLQVTSPINGDTVDVSKGFTITWTHISTDPSAIKIALVNNRTSFTRAIAFDLGVNLDSYYVSPATINYYNVSESIGRGGHGFQIELLSEELESFGTISDEFTITDSSFATSSTTSSAKPPVLTVFIPASSSAPTATTNAFLKPTVNAGNTSGLTPDGKACIAVGVVIGVAICVILAVLAVILSRHRQSRRRHSDEKHELAGDYTYKPESQKELPVLAKQREIQELPT
jgi:hypothetical protein